MKTIVHKSDSRGTASFGWLYSRHSFSFGNYYHPDKIQFGALRVLNDDIVEAGMGFGTHPHENMEIVSIPLQGDLEHKDSTGNKEVIKTGDVQIMSAGSGIMHSEYNHSKTDKVNFLQIWVLPKELNIAPRYEQKSYHTKDRINRLQTVVAPDCENAVWINQDSWFHLTKLEPGKSIEYTLKSQSNGVYVFVIDGVIRVGEQTLVKRDAIGIYDTDNFNIESSKESEVLLIEVPLK